jgi:hypothetical protein
MKEVHEERSPQNREPQQKYESTVVHFEKAGIKGASSSFRDMKMQTGVFQLVSAVIGLSLAVSVMTATVLLGVAALFE